MAKDGSRRARIEGLSIDSEDRIFDIHSGIRMWQAARKIVTGGS